jgi:integrase
VSGKLTALAVQRATRRGLYSDGGGLYLQVTPGGKSWIYRYTLRGKCRYMGLGSAAAITLKRARELAAEPRRLRAEGIDPIEHKRAQRRAAATQAVTFRHCAEDYVAAHMHGWRSPRHRQQWRTTLEADVYPILSNVPVADVDTQLVLQVLRPIWTTRTESASRLRGRIEAVLDAAKAAGLRSGENPARWRGHLDTLLPAPGRLHKAQHYAALSYRDVPTFMAELRSHPSISARALEFTILTAARTGETLGARWSEIDGNVWTISGTRMKAGREHRVPLSPAVLDMLKEVPNVGDYIFPGNRGGGLSQMAMNKMLAIMGKRGITVHGFRSSFRDWAAEVTDAPNDVVEMALAHSIKSAVEAAYRRGDLFEKRRKLMVAWAAYCSTNRRG